MKNYLPNGVVVAAGMLALPLVGDASDINYITQSFSQTFSLTASPTGDLPQINTTWSVNQYDGFGGLTSLSGVRYDLTTQIYYQGVLIAYGVNKSYNLQVRSDFNFSLPGSLGNVANLDPSIALSGTSPGTSLTLFNAPSSGTAGATQSATLLASDLATYVGSGVLPVVATGSLLSTASGGTFNNVSDNGQGSPYVFVDNAKVFPVFGLQDYSLVTTLTVTYTVPEPGTYAAGGFLAAIIAGKLWRNRKRQVVKPSGIAPA
ncbi:MAG TPA: hypothetical protein VMB21_01365 [Candidatus Limnocylindria bacterium]|jgi:hypothetical protein|nr:hypothetical protein [Candidatus Limnocylindria bacterium]